MPISKEDDKSWWEQYHIVLLSHILLSWIWTLLDSDASLLVTRISPPIFGLQHWCRFRKRMQLNMGGLWLNTLFFYFVFYHLYLFFLFFFFNFPSFCSLYFFFFYFLHQPIFISSKVTFLTASFISWLKSSDICFLIFDLFCNFEYFKITLLIDQK